ncbi:MAG TPA: hypothetical protein VGC13_30710 [Longimicrobium sp.]|uniref:hypothetical protein n=1 Tax=Longimicrobium sp. TaxID=2029185 RepID=UPI002ED9E64B
MARLTVEAVAEDTLVAPEERPTNRIVASVTDPNGEPVTGLTAANFLIDPMAAGNAAKVNVARVSAARLPGFYHIDVVPNGAEPRPRSVQVFAIAASRGADKGQTLATLAVD